MAPPEPRTQPAEDAWHRSPHSSLMSHVASSHSLGPNPSILLRQRTLKLLVGLYCIQGVPDVLPEAEDAGKTEVL